MLPPGGWKSLNQLSSWKARHMTAEIAVMNKSAVALAADSAATVKMERVHKIYMVNKLFALSDLHPVGVMIYGKPELLGVPWETVVSMYREKLGTKRFGMLGEYVEDFIKFIEKDKILFPQTLRNTYFKHSVTICYNQINKAIVKEVQLYTKKTRITKLKTKEIVDKITANFCDRSKEQDRLPNVSEEWVRSVVRKHSAIINEVKNEVFVKLPISAKANMNLRKMVGYLFTRDIFREDSSGVVIAGFGNDDIHPRVKSFEIEGVVNGKAKYIARQKGEIGQDNDASIVPFAQRDMVDAFMGGIHPDYHEHLFSGLESLLMEKYPDNVLAEIKDLSEKKRKSVASKLGKINKGILDEYQQELQSHSYKEHIRPVIRAVSFLPKEELAEMAETLVSLISFKKRMSVDAAETVGGPIDVAVISKTHGFVWIKHKSYFKQELNPQLSGS